VQVGAFAYLENARQRLAEAQAIGFNDAYIYQKLIQGEAGAAGFGDAYIYEKQF